MQLVDEMLYSGYDECFIINKLKRLRATYACSETVQTLTVHPNESWRAKLTEWWESCSWKRCTMMVTEPDSLNLGWWLTSAGGQIGTGSSH